MAARNIEEAADLEQHYLTRLLRLTAEAGTSHCSEQSHVPSPILLLRESWTMPTSCVRWTQEDRQGYRRPSVWRPSSRMALLLHSALPIEITPRCWLVLSSAFQNLMYLQWYRGTHGWYTDAGRSYVVWQEILDNNVTVAPDTVLHVWKWWWPIDNDTFTGARPWRRVDRYFRCFAGAEGMPAALFLAH